MSNSPDQPSGTRRRPRISDSDAGSYTSGSNDQPSVTRPQSLQTSGQHSNAGDHPRSSSFDENANSLHGLGSFSLPTAFENLSINSAANRNEGTIVTSPTVQSSTTANPSSSFANSVLGRRVDSEIIRCLYSSAPIAQRSGAVSSERTASRYSRPSGDCQSRANPSSSFGHSVAPSLHQLPTAFENLSIQSTASRGEETNATAPTQPRSETVSPRSPCALNLVADPNPSNENNFTSSTDCTTQGPYAYPDAVSFERTSSQYSGTGNNRRHYRVLRISCATGSRNKNFGSRAGDPRSMQKRFACTMCKRTFPTRSCLECHERVHSHANPTGEGPRPYVCQYCGRRYRLAIQLIRHVNAHEVPHECSFCGVRFASLHELNTHERTQH